MRRFMSVALIGLAVAGTSTVAAAQANGQGRVASREGIRADSGRALGRRGPRSGARGALAGITLTDVQKASLKDIHKKYGEQMKTLRQQNPGKGAAQNVQARTQFQAIAQREQADIRAVLTPAQQTQYDANVARMRDRKGKHPTDRRVGK
jgi:Spy/CpxP family protein refolding chaperone